jgi:hypothetical protein
MPKLIKTRENAELIADGKPLVFKDGVCEVKTITEDIKALIDANYIEETKDGVAK